MKSERVHCSRSRQRAAYSEIPSDQGEINIVVRNFGRIHASIIIHGINAEMPFSNRQ